MDRFFGFLISHVCDGKVVVGSEEQGVTQSRKAAIIAVCIITFLTVGKFALYWFSGSFAVLSEAWHSFSDIATTLLVLVAIIRQENKSKAPLPTQKKNTEDLENNSENKIFFLKRLYLWIRAVNTQLKISFVIGLVLLSASGTILWNAIFAPSAKINAPLISGLIFIGLSFGSFVLYKFERQIGETENSPALIADSYHNRADLIISLFTGLSLLLYYFGYNVDKYAGGLIALYLFIFATELLGNSIISIYKGKNNLHLALNFTSIIWKVFDSSLYLRILKGIEEQLGLTDRVKKVIRALPGLLKWVKRWFIRSSILAGCLLYCSTFFFTVGADEQGLLFRFGKLVNTEKPISSGLHLKLPYPIDSAQRYKTETVQSLSVGNISGLDNPMIWTREHGDNKSFLTGNNNFLLPYVAVHYKIRDIYDYALHFSDSAPEKLLKSASLQRISEVFSTTSFYDLVLYKRGAWTEEVKNFLQQKCDELGLGIEVISFNLRDLHPPVDLADSYEAVVAASQKKEALLNDAERKVNALMSRERIDRMRTKAQAESYVIEKKKTAEGEAANYTLRYQGYKEGGGVMKEILHLQSAQKALQGKKLYIVDPDSGIGDQLIYIENYMTGK